MVCLQEQLLRFNQKPSVKADMMYRSKKGKEMGAPEVRAHGRGDSGDGAGWATHELSAPGPQVLQMPSVLVCGTLSWGWHSCGGEEVIARLLLVAVALRYNGFAMGLLSFYLERNYFISDN